MPPTKTPLNNTFTGKRLRGSGSSGRNRPGSKARRASRATDDTPTGPPRQHPPSSNDFPPLTFGLQDGIVFDSQPTATSGVDVANPITSILSRPPGLATVAGTSTGVGIGGRNMVTGMGQMILPQRGSDSRTIFGNMAPTSFNEFMGGRRGEMSLDGPQVSSYLGTLQFSRRGNLLPLHPSVSGTSTVTSTRANNTPAPPTTTSSPNIFALSAAAGTSLTHRSAEYEISKNFDRLRIQGAHLGLTGSPCFPKCKEDLIKHREERKNDARDAMNKRIQQKEELLRLKSTEGCEGALVKIKPAFGGKVFDDGLSSMFARLTMWCHPELDKEPAEIVEWPSLTEVKQAGSKKTGLPGPKYKSGDGFSWDYLMFAGDRIGLGKGHIEEEVVFDEHEIKKMGAMSALFEEIDA